MRGLRGPGVAQVGEDRSFGAPIYQRTQHAHSVRSAASAGIVLRVGEHEGLAGAVALGPRIGDRFAGLPDLPRESSLFRIHQRKQAIRRFVRRVLRRRIRDDGRSAFRDVRRRESKGEGRAHDFTTLRIGHRAIKALRRLDQRALPGQRHQEIGAPHRLEQRPLARQPVQHHRGSRTRFRQIDMRIGPAYHQRGSMLHHALGNVGVEIETDDDRQIRPHAFAQALQQLAFAVLLMLRHHRAVKIEIEAVDLAQRADPLQQLADDLLIGVDLNLRRRRSGAPQGRQ